MSATGQIFIVHNPAARASLRRVPRVNQYKATTSPFCLVHSKLHQLKPGYISDRFSQIMVFEHPFTIQLFKGNGAVFINQLATEFMSKILSPASYSLMDTRYNLSPLSSFSSTFLCLRQLALCLSQFLFIFRKKRGLSIFCPVERVAKLSSPTSIPTAFSDGSKGSGSISQLKQAYHLPVLRRLKVKVFGLPSRGR